MAKNIVGLFVGTLMGIAAFTAGPALADEFVSVSDTDIESLAAGDVRGFDKSFVNKDINFSDYKSAYLETPMEFMIQDEDVADALRSKDESALERYLVRAFDDALDGTMAENGGEGVLMVQVFLLDVEPNTDLFGDFPRDSRSGLRSRGGATKTVGIGGAEAEIVLRDGASGDIVAVLSDQFRGDSFNSNFNLHTRWGDARDAFRRWARGVRHLID